MRRAVGQVDGLSDLLAREHLVATDDVPALCEEVEHTLAPRRRFYEYREANAYALEAEGLVQVIEEHAGAAAALPGSLDRAGRRRLATWLHKFRFSGEQDFFEVDVDAYAAALGDDGVAHYRALIERSADAGGEEFAVTHARTRLAILDRDPQAIVRVVGGDLTTQHQAIAVVEALDDAGLGRLAVQHASRGLVLPRTHRHRVLVDRLVVDAVERGDLAEAVALRCDHFRIEPTGVTFAALRSAAEDAGTWAQERAAAEGRLAEHRPHDHITMLLGEERDDEAWAFAMTHPQAASAAGAWERLCRRRAITAPADTLPVYRELVTATLRTTDRGAYVAGARMLERMRSAALAAGREAEFRAYLTETVEANRRRPACLQLFRAQGLIRADRSVM